jgi:hypothetical protein
VADFTFVWMAGQIRRGQPDNLQLLAAVDGIDPESGRDALTRFHFDEDEHSSSPHDQIDFAAAHPDVASDDAVTAEAVEPRSAPFAASSE